MKISFFLCDCVLTWQLIIWKYVHSEFLKQGIYVPQTTVCSEKLILCGNIIRVLIYRVRINYRSILQNLIFTNTEQKYMILLPFERGMFAVSSSDHDVQIVLRTRVEPPQNCYIAQIPGHTNYARSVRQPFYAFPARWQ
jgi:uncharacterized membrane protein